MPTQRKPISFDFQSCQGRRVAAAFNGGTITSHAGALLLRESGRAIGLFDRVAACFTDHRDPRLTEHSVSTLVAQRIVALALGYEDLNDHDQLRHIPCWAFSATIPGPPGRTAPPWPARARSTGSNTRPKVESRAGTTGSATTRRRCRPSSPSCFIESRTGPPSARLVLDIDCTDDDTSANRSGRYQLERQLLGGIRTQQESAPFHGALRNPG